LGDELSLKTQQITQIKCEEDIVEVRAVVKRAAINAGFSLINQTKIVTAASELARNTLDYGQGGTMKLELLEADRIGLRLQFEDHGPGIENVSLALKDGWTSGKGMGLGLSGSKRLMDEFDLATAPGKGTVVTITKWR
jgi:serine/threonine-protein kinase RsbT